METNSLVAKLILKKDKKLGNKERQELYKFIKKYSIKEA